MDFSKPVVSESIVYEPKVRRAAGRVILAFHPGLRFILIFLTGTISLIIVVASTFLLLSQQRRQLIENAQSSASVLSQTIEANLQHAMLTNDRTMIDDILQAVAGGGNVDSIRILDTHGAVGFSSNRHEIGEQFNQTEPACQVCHLDADPAGNKTVLFTPNSGRQVLLNVNLIHNQPACQACHSPQDQVLGLLMIQTPMTILNGQLSTGFWRTVLLAMGTFVLLIGLLVPALNRYIVQPVEELSKGVTEISAGNLDYQVETVKYGELGALATSFAWMQKKLKSSYVLMERREQDLATLNDVGFAVTHLLDLQEILDFTLNTVENKLGVAAALIYLWNEAEGRYTLHASRGVTEAQIEEIDRRRSSGWDITREVAETGKALFVADMAADIRFQGLWDSSLGRSYAKLPLMSRGMVVGVIGLITPNGQPLTQPEMEFLKSMGPKIGLAIDNALLLADTRRREQEAVTLYELGTKISASLNLHEVLDAVAEAARVLLNADVGLVGLLDEELPEVVIKAAAGTRAEALKGMRIPVYGNATGRVLIKGQPIMVEVFNPDQPILHTEDSLAGEQIASFLAVPLQRGEYFLGMVEVIARQHRRFLEQDLQLLMRLAHHVVVSIENAQLYRQLRYLAALDERNHLAREMHDHLAQALGYLNVRASMIEDLFTSGRIDQAQESLKELKRVAKLVYTDVRESIFNLRTPVSSQMRLVPTLQDYLEEYRTYYGVDSRLLVDFEDEPRLSPEVASQLLRILQEALTNVRKHANASRVLVRYQQDGDQIRLDIEDDGRGIDLAEATGVGQQHYGLQIMRERAESVSGSLELDSRPGQGTRVIVRVPANLLC